MSLWLSVHEGEPAPDVCPHANGALAPAVVARRTISATVSKVRHLSALRFLGNIISSVQPRRLRRVIHLIIKDHTDSLLGPVYEATTRTV